MPKQLQHIGCIGEQQALACDQPCYKVLAKGKVLITTAGFALAKPSHRYKVLAEGKVLIATAGFA